MTTPRVAGKERRGGGGGKEGEEATRVDLKKWPGQLLQVAGGGGEGKEREEGRGMKEKKRRRGRGGGEEGGRGE